LFDRKLAFILGKFSLCQDKNARKVLAHFRLRRSQLETKIWWNPQVQHRTRSLALSDRGSHCNQEEWLKEPEDTSSANEAKGQNTTSASRMKLPENRRDSETSTRESSADVDVDKYVDLEISSFWLHEAWFQKMSGE